MGASQLADTVLVLGGARSGKSRYAESLLTALPAPWVYVATAEALDDEMARRIKTHQARRAAGWITIEAPIDLPGAIRGAPKRPLLVDCLTLWLSNLLLSDQEPSAYADRLERALAAREERVVIVANEVGLGIVPDNALARKFRDAAGLLNQRMASLAQQVFWVAAGLPLRLK
jgi:adenosyl cobinamide kinase/adenosyl cobinamide phosphate guanylyltransferase